MDLQTRLTSHVFRYDEDSLVSLAGQRNPIVEELMGKLSAEQQRLERLLPDPPPGYHWVWEIQSHGGLNLASSSGVIQYRIVYKLKEF
ncbi:hypothetical protein SEA_MCGALLEON_46 [Microbacterium phage McGalleon]|uniref:Uncharacterized protein n=1 Tax=Microbacterium phage McGalleon TaxID=2590936 RepID=A0A516KQX8_9CAUD|nr:hypothetical protein H3N88_gp46 [Microbacterium phage McGalleon]QDP44097.1 hypothetical protein SEA_MCGALLEON_46 [Microbacterium phage McGalleon]